MANSRKRISELPPLNVASLDTTFVLGISGSTTYKISINNLTSSLDGAFATDLVTATLSNTLDTKLSTSSFNSYTASAINGTISGSSQLTSSFDQRYVISGSITQTTWDNIANKPAGIVSQSTDLSSLNTFTASISTASLVNRLNTIESVSGSWVTESETGSFLTSLNGTISSSAQITAFGFVSGSYLTSLSGAISSSSQLTSSFDTRYAASGSAPTLFLLEAYANETYTLPGGFTDDTCRYSIVNNNVNVPSNWFNTSTYRFTPQKAGYWEIIASYDVYRNSEASLAIKKNADIVAAAGSFNAVAQQIRKIIYLNGSTDYISIINVGGAALQRAQYDSRSWFQAKWIGQ